MKNTAGLVKLGASCEHIAGERHRFGLFDLNGLVNDLGGKDGSVIPIGGLRVGRYGLVVMGFVAMDIHAVLRNVIWEDEHCSVCCGAMLRFRDAFFDGAVLMRCGPTIGAEWDKLTTAQARTITDEYWTD